MLLGGLSNPTTPATCVSSAEKRTSDKSPQGYASGLLSGGSNTWPSATSRPFAPGKTAAAGAAIHAPTPKTSNSTKPPDRARPRKPIPPIPRFNRHRTARRSQAATNPPAILRRPAHGRHVSVEDQLTA